MTEILETPKLVRFRRFESAMWCGAGQAWLRIRVLSGRNSRATQPLACRADPAVQANLRMRWSVDRAVEAPTMSSTSSASSTAPARRPFRPCRSTAPATSPRRPAAGAGLTHGSAIGADADSPSVYARTKAAGEKAVFETVKDAVVFRPSIVFGPEDQFFNRFANMARFSPVLPLIGGGTTKFQPVFVGDVAEAVARSVDGVVEGGRVYELGGPNVMTFRQCMEEMLEIIERRRLLAPMPWWLAEIQGAVLGLLPKPLLTRDQVTLLKTDNVVSRQAEEGRRTFAGLGIHPQSTASVLPSYLWRYRTAGQFTRKSEA